MANTLKFGNGQWATGNGTALAYNDENANFKPLPFDFTRASSGTTVNQSGLIETVGSGIPRIDFQGNTKGALLLEPARTNLVTYSEDFSNAYWIKTEATVTLNTTTSPDGSLNASKLTPSTINSNHKIASGSVPIVSSLTSYWFVKSNGYSKVSLREDAAVGKYASFDLSQGIVLDSSTSSKIEDYGNGWFRIELNDDLTNVTARNSLYVLPDSYISGSPNLVNWSADGTSSIFIWGAQSEEGSYATSYIPTSGSAVTRVADSCSQTIPNTLVSTNGGTLFFEMDSFSDELQLFTLSDGTDINRVQLYYIPTNQFKIYLAIGNVGLVNTGVTITPTNNNKFAFKWSALGTNLFINGVSVYSNAVSCVFPSGTLDTFNFKDSTNTLYPLLGKIPDVRIYNTALTDAELKALTT